MKHLSAILFLLLPFARLAAQNTCDADFSNNTGQITFADDALGWGDSAVFIPITNNSGFNFAYPQAKLIHQTPLPPGMTIHPAYVNWMPFASSWNNTQTATYQCSYYVAQPIPANYTVTFRLWLAPNDTSVIYDSCYFSQDFTLNLNPQTSIAENETLTEVTAFPNPAKDEIIFSNKNALVFATARIINMQGQEVQTATLTNNRLTISGLAEGLYFAYLYDREGVLQGKVKLTVTGNQ